MRLLILGGSGMLGPQLWRGLHAQHDTWVTLLRPVADFAVHNLFDEAKAIQFEDITDDTALERALGQAKPEAVINCVGLIKQRDEASDEALTLRVNAEFPHRLAKRCGEAGARLIHFSTDCIFAGTKGNYTESDPSDAADLYGQSKHQGEVADAHSVTLRTSVIGHELGTNLALLDWFLSQRFKAVNGYTKAIYSGLTTLEMARIVIDLGVDVNATDQRGNPALHDSVRKGFGSVVELLAAHGADVNARNERDEAPLTLAESVLTVPGSAGLKTKRPEIAELLRRLGAND